MKKIWWKSITLWFNASLGLLPVALEMLAPQLPAIKPYIPDQLYTYVFLVVTIGNVVIRVFMTKSAVSFSAPSPIPIVEVKK